MEPKIADKPTLDVEVTHEVFELIEQEDEAQILSELQGRVTEKYVYELKQKDENGKPIYGLSWAGTNWACREFAKRGEAIRTITKPEIQADPISNEHIIVSVVAQRVAVNTETGRETYLDSSVGVKRQWVKRKRNIWKDGQKVGEEVLVDDFYVEKAVSKAQRNAKQALLPVDFVKQVILQALEQKMHPKATAKPAASSAKPAAAPAAAKPAAPAAAKAAPGAAPAAKPAAKSTDPMGALRQKFWTVLKRASGITDDTEARKLLKELSGREKVSELSEQELKDLGNALAGVINGTNEFHQNAMSGFRMVVEKESRNVLFPIPQAVAEPAPPVEAAPDGEEPVMF